MKKLITSIVALVFALAVTGVSFAADKAATAEKPAPAKVEEKKADDKKVADKTAKKAHHHKKAKKAKKAEKTEPKPAEATK